MPSLPPPLRVAFAAAEAAPFAKVGGLADVAGSLPQALVRLGCAVTLYVPLHGTIDRAKWGIPDDGVERSVRYGASHVRVAYPATERDGVRVVFVANKRVGRDRVYGAPDDAKRYAFFCRAVATALADEPADIVHAHDWHAALLIPMVVRTSATVFTIHNLAYQGKTSAEILGPVGLAKTRVPPEKPGECNPMARAIARANIVSTVSPRYAKEILTPEFGEGLEGLLQQRKTDVRGIVNGIDTALFDPANDPHIAASYSGEDRRGKAQCKAALQAEGGLRVDAETPVLGIIGRLVEQKGVDLLTAVAPDLLEGGAQLVVLGTGDPAYEERWRKLRERYPSRLFLTLGFDAGLAQRIYAGCDLFLMPSRFEPCGLGQLISLRYGTIPVVRAVGGLADTVRDLDEHPRDGNGFSFIQYDRTAFSGALARALRAYRRDGDLWNELRGRAMREDHSWTASAKQYVDVYRLAQKRYRG
ncbi:MAG TPA: glycogen/starch synthase [Candidatus Saccharimonadales bacterium]|jgi:starch synthase|nr:glycogen/starch synthase [Candidatus Saccharimonadales bacterium]